MDYDSVTGIHDTKHLSRAIRGSRPMDGPSSFGLIPLDDALLVVGFVFGTTMVGGLIYACLFGRGGVRKRELEAARAEAMRQLDAVNREAFLERQRSLAAKDARRRRAKRLRRAALKKGAEQKHIGGLGASS
jgi:hypothetical protein